MPCVACRRARVHADAQARKWPLCRVLCTPRSRLKHQVRYTYQQGGSGNPNHSSVHILWFAQILMQICGTPFGPGTT